MKLNMTDIKYPQLVEPDDNELIRNCISGDKNSFGILVRRYQRYVSIIVFRIIWDEEEVKDIVQETFIKVWDNLSRYRNDIKISTWIYRIAVNCSLDRLRKIKSSGKYFCRIDNNTLNLPAYKTSDSFEEEYDKKEIVENIKNLSRELSYMQRTVFALVDVGKMNIAETADVLNVSVNSVKTNLSYARKNIRIKLMKIQNRGEKNEMQ